MSRENTGHGGPEDYRIRRLIDAMAVCHGEEACKLIAHRILEIDSCDKHNTSYSYQPGELVGMVSEKELNTYKGTINWLVNYLQSYEEHSRIIKKILGDYYEYKNRVGLDTSI